MMPRKVEISHRTIVFTALFLMFVGFLYYIKDLILQVFVALLIMAILNPLVSKLSKYRIPRAASILVVYVVTLGVIIVSLASIVPHLIEQTTGFALRLPAYVQNLGLERYVSPQVTDQFLAQIGNVPGQVAGFILSILSNVIVILAVLTFAFYFLMERDRLNDLTAYVGERRAREIKELIDELEKKLGGWARGQLFLMVIVGVFSYFGLLILGIPFALPLAILAGLLEIVPYIGPILGAIPSVIIGFSITPLMGLAVIALAFLIQQLENYVFVPKVMQRSVGVVPVATLISLAIGFKLAGIAGILISVPVLITAQVVAKKYFFSR